MKLEEVMGAYRAGRVIVSCKGFHYCTDTEAAYPLHAASEVELLGEWTIEKTKVKKEIKRYVVMAHWGAVSTHILYEDAQNAASKECGRFIVTLAGTYEVEE